MADRDELDWIEEHEPWRVGKVVVNKPTNKWTEREINEWIMENRLPIDYDIRRRTKKWALNQISNLSN